MWRHLLVVAVEPRWTRGCWDDLPTRSPNKCFINERELKVPHRLEILHLEHHEETLLEIAFPLKRQRKDSRSDWCIQSAVEWRPWELQGPDQAQSHGCAGSREAWCYGEETMGFILRKDIFRCTRAGRKDREDHSEILCNRNGGCKSGSNSCRDRMGWCMCFASGQ